MVTLLNFSKSLLAILFCTIAMGAGAQGLAGNWDVIESADGQGEVAGKMVLSRDGSIIIDGQKGTWRPSGNGLTFTVIGAAGVPAVEGSLQLSGNVLRGTLVAFSYKLQNNSVVPTGQKNYPLSARRPVGYAQETSTAPGSSSVATDRRNPEEQQRRDPDRQRAAADNSRANANANANSPPSTGTRPGAASNGSNNSSSSQKTAQASPQNKPVEYETCVLEGTGICRGGATTSRRGGTFYVKQPNNCGYRLYAQICIKTKSGRDDCGADSAKPGGSISMWHSSDDATGAFTVNAVGVLKGGDDWTCMGKKRKLGLQD